MTPPDEPRIEPTTELQDADAPVSEGDAGAGAGARGEAKPPADTEDGEAVDAGAEAPDAPAAEASAAEASAAVDLADPDLVTAALALERRIHALPERPMRRAVLREVVLGFGTGELVGVLHQATRRSANGRGHARELLQEMALEPTVFREMPYETVREAYGLAREAELADVASLLLSSTRPRDNPTVDEAFRGNDFVDHPVGRRREWARGRDRDKLDRLLHDRDHRVIAHLLENPRIVERDVVKVAAMRPTRPEVLELIARHRRWSSRYPVRKALALNPYTPENIVRRLLPTLMRQDLRQGIEAGVLAPELAAEARRLYRTKGR